MIDAAWEAKYHGQRLGEAFRKYKDWGEIAYRLAELGCEDSRFTNIVRIRTETDPTKIADFTPEEKEIYNDWRRKIMTEEERIEEDLQAANTLFSLLKS